MDPILMLKRQHREAAELISRMENTLDRADRRMLMAALADDLAVHMRLEERCFYPAIRTPTTEPIIYDSEDEHAELKATLLHLLNEARADGHLDSHLALLKAQLQHHVHSEETELFPAVRRLFEPSWLTELASDMVHVEEELRQGRPREELAAYGSQVGQGR